jgi:uncharacterized protein
MSQENVELLQTGFEILARDGVEALLEYLTGILDPDFEAPAPPELSVEPTTYRGAEGVRRWFESFYEVMDEIRLEPEEFIDAGDHVVVPLILSAKGQGTGIEVEQRIVQVWTLRSGRVLRMDTYVDRALALRAAGLDS